MFKNLCLPPGKLTGNLKRNSSKRLLGFKQSSRGPSKGTSSSLRSTVDGSSSLQSSTSRHSVSSPDCSELLPVPICIKISEYSFMVCMDMNSLLRMSQNTFSMFVFLPLNASCDPIIIYCTVLSIQESSRTGV